MTTDWNAEFDAVIRPMKKSTRPVQAAWMLEEPQEYEPVESWGPPLPPLPKPRPPSRIGAALVLLLAAVPLPMMPALLVVPFVAGLFVFVGLVAGMGWHTAP